ncbi:MAG: cbb3-type cytochrome c oxidase N-terminal domain-containing protein [Phycisphaerales bacterium]
MKTEFDKLMDHEYDGIREYDNPTPGWWHMIFLSSIVFSVFYFVFWEYSPMAYSVQEAWDKRQAVEFKKIFGAYGEMAADEPTIQKMRGDAKMMIVANSIFQANCAQCHNSDGGAAGKTGVNLTDNAYKNVKKLTDVYDVIVKGANNLAMPAWENRLSQNQRVIMAAYVANLRGKNVAGGKAPEGAEIAPWPEAK